MADKKKQICKYGIKCYQKNAMHLSKFEHPDRDLAAAAAIKIKPQAPKQQPPSPLFQSSSSVDAQQPKKENNKIDDIVLSPNRETRNSLKKKRSLSISPSSSISSSPSSSSSSSPQSSTATGSGDNNAVNRNKRPRMSMNNSISLNPKTSSDSNSPTTTTTNNTTDQNKEDYSLRLRPKTSPTQTSPKNGNNQLETPTTPKRKSKSKSKSPGNSNNNNNNGSTDASAATTPNGRRKTSPKDSHHHQPNKEDEDNNKQRQQRPRILDCSDGPDQDNDIDFINDIFDKETRFSQRAEYKEMLLKPEIFIKHKFLVTMPDDFYKFWDFCNSYVKNNNNNNLKTTGTAESTTPTTAAVTTSPTTPTTTGLKTNKLKLPENLFEPFGLRLIGPFDVLSGKFTDARMFEPGEYLRHWRFFYDPPEFQACLKKDKSGIHYGYWRDSPQQDTDCFLARNDVHKGCEFNFIADNIFSAVLHFLEKDSQALTPFNRIAMQPIKKAMEDYMKVNNISGTEFSQKLKRRNGLVVCKTFNRAGLIVPYDRKTQIGYRELIETEANLKKILASFRKADGDPQSISNVMEKLYPLIAAANIAVDECDFGNALELGIDFFCSGASELHVLLLQFLVNGYSMIGKPQFIAIVKAHVANRKHGENLSIL